MLLETAGDCWGLLGTAGDCWGLLGTALSTVCGARSVGSVTQSVEESVHKVWKKV
jgi:hypothetical protein